MKVQADLHSHTTCSDGVLSPEELVNKAAERGLKHLAITDHDTLEAHRQLRSITIPPHLEVITGVEISCNESGREIHVLGYHLDPDNDRLRSFEESFRADRDRRARSIVDNLRAQQVDITYDAVLEESKGGLIGRPHIAEVLVNKGYVSSIKKAFDRYLATDRPAYVARAPFTVAQAVELIRSSGGVAVIAHPHRMYMNPKTFLRLISSGIDGVEVYHPSHWPLTADFYRTLAERHHLLITGGSDFHGNREYDERNFGTVGATKQMVEALHIRALQRTLHGR